MRAFVDKLITRLIGLPVEVTFPLSPRLLLGRISNCRVVIRGATAGGLLLEEVDVRLRGVALVPNWPPRLRIAQVEAHIHLDQSSLDSWSKRVGLPVRIRLRPGRVVARTGIAGLRLSEADMDVQLEDRRLLLVPRRINVLGMEAAGSRLRPVALPLPQLPRDARLESLDPRESALDARLAVDELDEPLTRKRLRTLSKMTSKVAGPKERDESAGDPFEAEPSPRPNPRSHPNRHPSGPDRQVRDDSTARRPSRGLGGIIEATVLDVSEAAKKRRELDRGERSE